ncbi:hypothetical protein BGY98DRAFT_1012690 [Russula aff. rugulosa BPL654]|nr:hypothetical protein BGY98DRAFT_1012690 [Russula aff. rugulosa BPL654]
MHFMLREWLVGCLTALTNYSMYAIQDGTHLSGPIHFTSLIRPISFFLFCLCADEFVGSGSGRIEWQHCFLSSYIDCHIARARRTRYPARQRARVQRVKYAKHTHDAPTCLPLQFYRKSTPQPVVAITTRSYKHGQIVRRLTAVGSAFPANTAYPKIGILTSFAVTIISLDTACALLVLTTFVLC